MSEVFAVGGRKWKLRLYPKGKSTGSVRDKYLSLYLLLADCKSLPPGWRLYVEYKLRIKSQVNTSHYEQTVIKKWLSGSETSWGFPKFLSLTNLKSESKGYMVNDTLVVECQIMVMSMLKYSL